MVKIDNNDDDDDAQIKTLQNRLKITKTITMKQI